MPITHIGIHRDETADRYRSAKRRFAGEFRPTLPTVSSFQAEIQNCVPSCGLRGARAGPNRDEQWIIRCAEDLHVRVSNIGEPLLQLVVPISADKLRLII